MIDIRIVCSHDAVKLAETLMRLLEAEEHRVRLTYGRQALSELEDARGARDAVLLIWSPNARSQTYMLEWVRNIEPARLVEIARETHANDWPPIKRLAAVIDFTNWRGQRGARSWKALTERLDAITRALGPPTLPTRTLLAASVAGMAAVVGVAMVRGDGPVETQIGPTPLSEVAVTQPNAGVGGPLNATEPASLEDGVLRVRHFRHIELIEPLPVEPLANLPEYEEYELRNRTLLERLNAYNPLRRASDDPAQ
jgi:hypothetical protein